MESFGKLSHIFAFLLLGGCAAYQLPPLTAGHPANPEATAAPEPPLSQTLAYTQVDIPRVRPVAAAGEGREGAQGSRPSEASVQETVVGEGKVIATVPNAGQIVVEHGEIKDFMEAMTMGYKIDPPSLLEGLKFGDKIRFTIDVQKKAIIKIEKLKE